MLTPPSLEKKKFKVDVLHRLTKAIPGKRHHLSKSSSIATSSVATNQNILWHHQKIQMQRCDRCPRQKHEPSAGLHRLGCCRNKISYLVSLPILHHAATKFSPLMILNGATPSLTPYKRPITLFFFLPFFASPKRLSPTRIPHQMFFFS